MGFNDQQNRIIANNIIDQLKLNPISDNIPKQVVATIQPTFEVNRKIPNVFGNASTSSSNTTSTLLTASSTQDTYICGYMLGLAKDATADVTNGIQSLAMTVNGSTIIIANIPFATLVTSSDCVTGSLNPAIKIDKASTVRFTSPTFTVGTLRSTATVYGYSEESGTP